MLVQQQDVEREIAGPCSDCAAIVARRVECIDAMTHSTLELCHTCWNAYRQRQFFADGCCG